MRQNNKVQRLGSGNTSPFAKIQTIQQRSGMQHLPMVSHKLIYFI